MFVTESRRIGVGPRGTDTGDQVALLSGSTVPFLLRSSGVVKCQDSSVEGLLPQATQMGAGGEQVCNSVHQCYVVMGDAFVSGIMDGDAVKNNVGQMEKIYLV